VEAVKVEKGTKVKWRPERQKGVARENEEARKEKFSGQGTFGGRKGRKRRIGVREDRQGRKVTLNWCMWRLEERNGRRGPDCGGRKRTKDERGQLEAQKEGKGGQEGGG
jgi:hypothetical protein